AALSLLRGALSHSAASLAPGLHCSFQYRAISASRTTSTNSELTRITTPVRMTKVNVWFCEILIKQPQFVCRHAAYNICRTEAEFILHKTQCSNTNTNNETIFNAMKETADYIECII